MVRNSGNWDRFWEGVVHVISWLLWYLKRVNSRFVCLSHSRTLNDEAQLDKRLVWLSDDTNCVNVFSFSLASTFPCS